MIRSCAAVVCLAAPLACTYSDGYVVSGSAGSGGANAPPSITSVSPSAGDFGTLVSIRGTNLAGVSATLALGDAHSIVLTPAEIGADPGAVLQSWTNDEIDVRWPFPAIGAVEVQTAGGIATGGDFLPSWQTIGPAPTSATWLFDVAEMPDGRVAALVGGPHAELVVFQGESATTMPLGIALDEGVLVRIPDPTLAIAGVSGGQAAVSLVETSGVMAWPSGPAAVHTAAGVDAMGLYVWVATGDGMVQRVRPLGGWTSDAGPIARPGASPFGIAAGPDGTLYAGDWVDTSDTFDSTGAPTVARLAPGTTAFDATEETAGSSIDDSVVSVGLRAGPNGQLLLWYCGHDTGATQGDPPYPCRTDRYRATGAWGSAGWGDLASGPGYAFADQSLVGAVVVDRSLHVGSASGDGPIAAFPIDAAAFPEDPPELHIREPYRPLASGQGVVLHDEQGVWLLLPR